MLLGVDNAQLKIDTNYSGNSFGQFMKGSVNSVFTEGDGENAGVAGGSGDSDSIWDKIFEAIAEWGNSLVNARKDVDGSSQRIDNSLERANQITQTKSEDISAILKDIKSNIQSITDAMELIQKMSGDEKGNLGDLQKKLAEEREKISCAIEVLRNPDATDEEKKEALSQIQTSQGIIAGLVVEVNALREKIEDVTCDVETYTENIDNRQNEAANLISDVVNMINAENKKVENETVVNEVTAAEGGNDIAEGIETTIAIETTNTVSIGTTSGATVEAQANAVEHIQGGKEKIQGSTENFRKIISTISTIGAYGTEIASFTETLGGYGDSSINAIGSYQNEMDATITAIGSWDIVAVANEDLGNALTNYTETDPQKQNKNDLLEFDVTRFDIA